MRAILEYRNFFLVCTCISFHMKPTDYAVVAGTI
jgi:hypothetical protein